MQTKEIADNYYIEVSAYADAFPEEKRFWASAVLDIGDNPKEELRHVMHAATQSLQHHLAQAIYHAKERAKCS